MSDRPADSPALAAPTQGDGWLAGPQPPNEGWTRNKFLFVIAFALALHIALIFVLGTKKQLTPRAVANVPHLQLAGVENEIIALGDPTLFARPNAHDFVTAFWQRTPAVRQPSFHWTEAPHYLVPVPEMFGADFREFMQASRLPERPPDFKPAPRPSELAIAFREPLPQKTTLSIAGELSQRRLLNQIELPSIAINDVIAPSKVQALVDPAGNVASAVLLESSTSGKADQRALQLTRNLRFAPAPRLMFGEISFTWHTVPVISTNEPSR